jgi:hypothetical protein
VLMPAVLQEVPKQLPCCCCTCGHCLPELQGIGQPACTAPAEGHPQGITISSPAGTAWTAVLADILTEPGKCGNATQPWQLKQHRPMPRHLLDGPALKCLPIKMLVHPCLPVLHNSLHCELLQMAGSLQVCNRTENIKVLLRLPC